MVQSGKHVIACYSPYFLNYWLEFNEIYRNPLEYVKVYAKFFIFPKNGFFHEIWHFFWNVEFQF